MGLAAHKLRMARLAAGGPSFDPLDSTWGSPFHRFYAGDPDWSNPGDGNAVSSWRNDGSNGTAATQGDGTRQPVYRATGVNGKPSLDFDGSNDYLLIAAVDTATLSSPNTLVIVVDPDAVSNQQYVIGGIDGGARNDIFHTAAGNWSIFDQSDVRTSSIAATAAVQVVIVKFSSVAHVMRVNGADGGSLSASVGPIDGLVLGAALNGSANFNGHIPYAAVYDEDILGEAWFSDFESGLIDFYGA